MSVSSTKFVNSISASLWYVSVFPFISATTSIIFMRCSPLAALAALIFCTGPFYIVVLVDAFPDHV